MTSLESDHRPSGRGLILASAAIVNDLVEGTSVRCAAASWLCCSSRLQKPHPLWDGQGYAIVVHAANLLYIRTMNLEPSTASIRVLGMDDACPGQEPPSRVFARFRSPQGLGGPSLIVKCHGVCATKADLARRAGRHGPDRIPTPWFGQTVRVRNAAAGVERVRWGGESTSRMLSSSGPLANGVHLVTAGRVSGSD